jgi:TolB-like protein/Tfp pilus assembly protein PilF
MSRMPDASSRLDSWKEIAAYLKRGVRTAQRWEQEEGLPIHRHNHLKSDSVYAYTTELDQWLDSCELRKPAEPLLAVAVQATNSIAVLPFVNMSADKESEYLSDGIAEELLNGLSSIRDLKVVARTSSFQFKGRNEDVRRIGEILGVRTVLEGSVRKEGGQLRIAVRLINVADGFQLWSEIYCRGFKEVFAIEREIAQSVTDALQIKLGIARASKLQTPNLDAFQFYLKGRYELGKRTAESLRKAIEHFGEAVRRDPAYASAHAGLAEANATLAGGGYVTSELETLNANAKRAVSKALALDPSLAEAHAALAIVKFRIDWNWNDCEREFRLAIKLNPSFAAAHHWFALYLAAMARFDEAVAEIQRAQELDPLSLIINTAFARVLHFAGQYDEAIEKCRNVLDMEPDFEQAHFNLGLACLEKSKFPEALRALDKAVTLSQSRTLFLAVLGHAYGRAGKRAAAVKVLKELETMRREKHVPALCYALVLAALGRKDEALEQFGQAIQERYGPVIYIKVEPMYASLHSRPEFADLLSAMNLGG